MADWSGNLDGKVSFDTLLPVEVEKLIREMAIWKEWEGNIGKVVGALSAAVVAILSELQGFSMYELKKLAESIDRVEKIKNEVEKYISNLQKQRKNIVNLKTSLRAWYNSETTFSSLKFIWNTRKNLWENLELIIELLDFLEIVQTPLEDLQSKLTGTMTQFFNQ